jgi:hypothetical protein
MSPLRPGRLERFYVITLSSPVMPCDIILLILSFICYGFFGLERVKPFQAPKIVAYEERN